jgi:hypothetical protein
MVLIAVFSCGIIDKLAGTSSETGTGTTISGVMVQENGNPAAKVTIYLRAADYAANPYTVADTTVVDSVITDDKGRFTFELEETGIFVIEACTDASQAVRIEIEKEEDKPLNLDQQVLLPAGSISGQVQAPGRLGLSIVQVLGTDRYAVPDSATGAFEIPDLAEGTYTLRAFGVRPKTDTVQSIDVNVTAGQQTQDIVLEFTRLSVLIVNGINNQDWSTIESHLKIILAEPALFIVDVSTSPPEGASAQEWDAWQPDFSAYHTLLLNYNSGTPFDRGQANPWPQRLYDQLENYVSGGGGLFLYHGFINAFYNWPVYPEIAGPVARETSDYPGLYIDSSDQQVVLPIDQGRPSETVLEQFTINVRNTGHPISAGLPPVWQHVTDAFDFGQRGSVTNVTVLSSTLNSYSGLNEPVDWVVQFGQGRVYANIMGYIETADLDMPLRCMGLQTLIIRGLEWTATGEVTYPVPGSFPTAADTSIADNLP